MPGDACRQRPVHRITLSWLTIGIQVHVGSGYLGRDFPRVDKYITTGIGQVQQEKAATAEAGRLRLDHGQGSDPHI